MVTLKAIARARSVSIANRIATMRNLYSVCCSPVGTREYRAARFVVVMAESRRCRGALSMAACQRERQLQRVWRPRLPRFPHRARVSAFSPWCPEILSRASRSFPVVVVEQSTETRPASDRIERRVVVARRCLRSDDLAANPLVVALGQVVGHEVLDHVPQVTLAEDDEVVQTLGTDRFHKPLRVRIAVRALCRNRHALHAAGLQ